MLPWKALAKKYRELNEALGDENERLWHAHTRFCSEDLTAARDDALEEAAQEAELNIIEFSEIDILDRTPEKDRIARRIRRMKTSPLAGDPTEGT